MTRETIDCRDVDDTCTVAISADNQEQLLKIAAQHAVQAHGYQDGDGLRVQLTKLVKNA